MNWYIAAFVTGVAVGAHIRSSVIRIGNYVRRTWKFITKMWRGVVRTYESTNW